MPCDLHVFVYSSRLGVSGRSVGVRINEPHPCQGRCDDATALLMVRFYQNLLGQRSGLEAPLGKAAALAEAKSWLRRLGIFPTDDSCSLRCTSA